MEVDSRGHRVVDGELRGSLVRAALLRASTPGHLNPYPNIVNLKYYSSDIAGQREDYSVRCIFTCTIPNIR